MAEVRALLGRRVAVLAPCRCGRGRGRGIRPPRVGRPMTLICAHGNLLCTLLTWRPETAFLAEKSDLRPVLTVAYSSLESLCLLREFS